MSTIPDEVFHKTLLAFLAPVAELLADAAVGEIVINGPEEVYAERGGRLERTSARFESEHALASAVRHIAQFAGVRVGPDRPILDARLPDGSRVCAVLPPAARGGTSLRIRRAPRERPTIAQLVAQGALSESARAFLDLCVVLRRNILVAGGAGAGKTTLLGALAGLIPAEERVVVVEDGAELRLARPHVVYLEARPADAKGRGAVPLRELFGAALRLRPDRIVVGECRGAEALDLVHALNAGHGGALATVQANDFQGLQGLQGALGRLESLCLAAGASLPPRALRAQIAEAVSVIVQTSRTSDGARRVTHIAETVGLDDAGGFWLRPLFELREAGVDPRTGAATTALTPTGERPSFHDEVVARDLALPVDMEEAYEDAGPTRVFEPETTDQIPLDALEPR